MKSVACLNLVENIGVDRRKKYFFGDAGIPLKIKRNKFPQPYLKVSSAHIPIKQDGEAVFMFAKECAFMQIHRQTKKTTDFTISRLLKPSGEYRSRTDDPLLAKQVL